MGAPACGRDSERKPRRNARIGVPLPHCRTSIPWHPIGAGIMAVLNNIKTYEPFADMVRGAPLLDWAGLFDMPRTRFTYPTVRGEPDIRTVSYTHLTLPT